MLKFLSAPRRRRTRKIQVLYGVKVSDAARKQLRLARKQGRKKYDDALEDAWKQINETIVRISRDHSKSYDAVQFALHMGRRQLTKQTRNRTSEWNAFQWWQNTHRNVQNGNLEGDGK
jgi:hypothetical protein